MAADTEPAPPPKKARFAMPPGSAASVPTPAAEAFTWHLIDASPETLDRELRRGGAMFKCEYYNQPFGEDEELVGYTGLKVDVWLDSVTFAAWVDVRYDTARTKATDVHAALNEWFPAGYARTRAEFEAAVKEARGAQAAAAADWDALGDEVPAPAGAPAGLVMRHVKLADAPKWFKDLHARVEPLLVFTIDGASLIDADDPRWEVVAAVVDDGAGRKLLAGFATVYNFYAWPTAARPRVAQVLVVPPRQGAGVGKALLGAAYALARARDAVDLTFEDPSPELQRAREKLEVEMLLATDWVAGPAAAAISEAAKHCGGDGKDPDAAALDAAAAALKLPADLAARITKELKIHPHRLRACWEAALGAHASMPRAGAGGAWRALAALVARRARDAAAQGGEQGQGKRVVDVPRDDRDEPDFFMWRPRRKAGSGSAGGGGGGDQAGGSNGGGGGEAEEDGGGGAVAVGRLAVTRVTAAELDDKVQAAAAERLGEIEELRRRIAGEPAPPSEEDEDEDEGDEDEEDDE